MKLTKTTINNLIIAALVAVVLCVLALPAFAQTSYSYPGHGSLVEQGGTTSINGKKYHNAAECESDARAENQRRKAAAPRLTVAVVECLYRTGFVDTWPAQTSGLGQLPANPRMHPGYSTERIGGTSEVAGPSNDGTGDFRTRCEPSHYAFDDPIVFPDQAGRSHLHVFFGNTGANATSTTTSLLSSGNSTCRGGTVNRSSYWVPAIVDTTTGLPVNPVESDFYYKSGYRGVSPSTIQPMPPGLRMIAGDSMNRTPDGAAYGTVYNWVCHNTGLNRGPTIPASCPAGDLLELSVFFPQCWNGELDSPDHKSHMAYGTGSGCPESHPRPLPEVSFHVLWPVPASGSLANWRLSSDTYDGPAGYSSHADWFNGWKKDVSDAWASGIRRGLDLHSHLISDGRAIY